MPVGRERALGFGGTVGVVFLCPLAACTASLERFVGWQTRDGCEICGAGEVPRSAADRPVVEAAVLDNVGC